MNKNNLLKNVANLSASLALAFFVGQSQASLIGQTITSQSYYGGGALNEVGSPGSFIGGSTTTSVGGNVVLSATTSQILVNFTNIADGYLNYMAPSIVSYHIGGLYITNGILLNVGQTISSVTLDSSSNMLGLTAANITYGGSLIAIDWGGLGSISNTTKVVLDVNTNPVPVPAAAWLLGSGLLSLIGVARRKAA